MATIFLDLKGIFLIDYLAEGQTNSRTDYVVFPGELEVVSTAERSAIVAMRLFFISIFDTSKNIWILILKCHEFLNYLEGPSFSRQDLKGYLIDRRFDVELGGLIFNQNKMVKFDILHTNWDLVLVSFEFWIWIFLTFSDIQGFYTISDFPSIILMCKRDSFSFLYILMFYSINATSPVSFYYSPNFYDLPHFIRHL